MSEPSSVFSQGLDCVYSRALPRFSLPRCSRRSCLIEPLPPPGESKAERNKQRNKEGSVSSCAFCVALAAARDFAFRARFRLSAGASRPTMSSGAAFYRVQAARLTALSRASSRVKLSFFCPSPHGGVRDARMHCFVAESSPSSVLAPPGVCVDSIAQHPAADAKRRQRRRLTCRKYNKGRPRIG